LLPTIDPKEAAKNEESFTAKEKAAIDTIASDECRDYWMKVYLVTPLCRWGATVRGFLHGCFCHEAELLEGKAIPCDHKGRNSSRFAGSMLDEFSGTLQSMPVPKPALELLREDPSLEPLTVEFLAARNAIVHRFVLFFGFWHKLPWAIVKLFEAEIDRRHVVKSRVVATARVLLELYDARGQTWFGEVAARFLDPGHPSGLRHHVVALSRRYQMSATLAQELYAYASALIVMQGLESRHHLGRIYMECARAAKLPAICANLRRHQNPDMRDPRFRERLDTYMERTHELVPPGTLGGQQLFKAQMKPQLYGIIYGCSADSMYARTDQEVMAIDAFKGKIARAVAPAGTAADQVERSFVAEHMRTLLEEGSVFYVAPEALEGGGGSDPDESKPFIFQMVSAHPERKATIEKISHMADLTWTPGTLAVAALQVDALRPGGGDELVCDLSMAVEPLDLFQFYNNGCHRRLHTFQAPGVQAVFDNLIGINEALPVQDQTEEDSAEARIDEDVMNRVGDAVASAQGLSETALVEYLPDLAAGTVRATLDRMGRSALLECTAGAGGVYRNKRLCHLTLQCELKGILYQNQTKTMALNGVVGPMASSA